MQRTHSLQQKRWCLPPPSSATSFLFVRRHLVSQTTIHSLLTYLLVHSFIHSFVHSFIHSFIYSFVRQFSLCHSALALISCQCLFRFLLKWKVNFRDWMVTGGGTANWLKSLRFCMLEKRPRSWRWHCWLLQHLLLCSSRAKKRELSTCQHCSLVYYSNCWIITTFSNS